MIKYIPVAHASIGFKELINKIKASFSVNHCNGRWNELFERKIKKLFGIQYVLTCNSGSSANLLAMSSLTSKLLKNPLKKGDEVITTALCFPTTINPIIQNNLKPIFIDVKLDTLNIDEDIIEKYITKKTRAIFATNTLGNPCNMDRLLSICKKHNLFLIEDNCDSTASKYKGKYTGTFGHISSMSFYPAHHITTGEGGAVITNDLTLYKAARSFRDWGRDCWCEPKHDNSCGKRFNCEYNRLPVGYDHKYVYSHIGYNLKFTEWQAALGCAQIDRINKFIEKRKYNYDSLYKTFTKINSFFLEENKPFLLLKKDKDIEPCMFGFPIVLNKIDRHEFVKFLERNKIGTRPLFAGNIIKQPAYEHLYKKEVNDRLPNTNYIMNNSFWIGCHPGIKKRHLKYIENTVIKYFKYKDML